MRPAALSIVAALTMLALGCEPRPAAPKDRPVVQAPFAPAWDAAAEAQAARLAGIGQLFASGPVELSWVDEEGSHFETCRGELFVRLPSETALALKKVGEMVLWLGSDSRRRWLLDLRTKEVVLWLVDLDRPVPKAGMEAPFPIRRVSLVDLLGLMPLPPAEELDAIFDAPSSREGSSLLVGEFYGEGGAVRVTIDTRTNLPVQVEALDDEGRPFLRSELASYESMERDGVAPGDLPRFPQRVAISVLEESDDLTTRDRGARSEVRLFLTPSLQGEDRITDQRFDLDVLIRTFKPVSTESR